MSAEGSEINFQPLSLPLQLLRIDVSTCTGGGDMDGTRGQELDTALRVKYAPASTRHLLVTTAKNKLIKLDAANGKVLSEVRASTMQKSWPKTPVINLPSPQPMQNK
jgi:hypothetical protein